MASQRPIAVSEVSRQRRQTAVAFLQHGFRPFFLGAALWAALAVPLWLVLHRADIAAPLALPAPTWHAHEMLFGYAVAVVAGFLLTAAPNWTGALPLSGWPLGLLFALWAAGRVGMLLGGVWPAGLAAILDVVFLPVFAGWVGWTLIRHGNRRNFPFIGVVAVLAAANAAVHLEGLGIWPDGGAYGITLALDLVLLLITLVGGRIVPSFTANALLAQKIATTIKPRPRLDRLTIGATIAMALADLAWRDSEFAAALAVAAGVLNFLRLSGWNSLRTLHSPILWVLHLGFFWLCGGLVLKGLGPWLPGPTATLWQHAATIGAIGTMTLAVMSRAALGHSGRRLEAAPATVAAYVLVSVATITRLAGALLPAELYMASLWLSAMAWSMAFALFAVVYWPIVSRPRADGKAY